MSALVFGLVALAAVLHVAWNVLLKTTGDPLRTSGRAVIAGLVAALPVSVIGWLMLGRPSIPAEAFGLAVASGLAEVAYFVFLSAAYQRGDLSLVYPIARGSAPLLAVASGVLVLGERLGPLGAVGVIALLAGILAVRRPWGALVPLLRRSAAADQPSAADPRARQAVLLALATGAMIATYSSIDRVGARLTEPWIYATMLWTVAAVGLWGWIRAMERFREARFAPVPPHAVDPARGDPAEAHFAAVPGDPADPADSDRREAANESDAEGWIRSIAIGLMLLVAYLLILVAFRLAPLTAVAPLRESAVVLASGWGAFRLAEGGSRREAALRIGGALLIVAGAVLLAVEG